MGANSAQTALLTFVIVQLDLEAEEVLQHRLVLEHHARNTAGVDARAKAGTYCWGVQDLDAIFLHTN